MQTSDDDDDDDIAEDETEWQSSLTELETHPAAAAAAAAAGSHIDGPPPQETSRRVILHFDLDCFYAQVEMIRNPALRNVPLGIQQKYIIVTCNYVARDQGVTKLMSVADAKVKCPNLVLVKGEDLTHYRETSYKVTELLMSYCPLVERLGFDENFMDITGMVERRLTQTTDSHNASFEGHVYNHASGADKAGDHPRLVLGSHIAAELRAAINTKLGLTGCAGVATNKLLAKLVSGTFKPNQQTTLLPENIGDIMGRLGGLRRVPGVGHQTSKRLRALGLVSVQDLQLFPRAELVREFGSPTAQRLGNLSLGIDGSPVTPSGAPQSLSDEDSFKKMSTTKEVFQKTQDLLSSLVERMHKDGRQPQTFRLTIRRYSATNKWFSRESRQCPIPNYLGQKISSGSSDAVAQLVAMAVKLFHKMVDGGAAFHLTLINVCFANLQSRGPAASGKGAITSFFSHSASPGKSQSSSQDQASPPSVRGRRTDHGFGCDVDSSYLETVITQDNFHKVAAAESAAGAPRHLHGSPTTKGPVVSAAPPDLQRVMCSTGGPESDGRTSEGLEFGCRLPPNVDPDVFRLLPEDIQRELLSPAFTGVQQGPSKPVAGPSRVDTFDSPPPRLYAPQLTLRPSTHSPRLGDTRQAVSDALNTADNQTSPGPSVAPGQATVEAQGPGARPPRLLSSECDFPMNVDPRVFSELPGDVQRDLMAEWKQQRPVLKTPSCIKQGRNSSAKDKKSAVKGNQRNNLYNYFKPN